MKYYSGGESHAGQRARRAGGPGGRNRAQEGDDERNVGLECAVKVHINGMTGRRTGRDKSRRGSRGQIWSALFLHVADSKTSRGAVLSDALFVRFAASLPASTAERRKGSRPQTDRGSQTEAGSSRQAGRRVGSLSRGSHTRARAHIQRITVLSQHEGVGVGEMLPTGALI